VNRVAKERPRGSRPDGPRVGVMFLGRGQEPAIGLWGSAVSFPSGVWGGAPAEIEFGAF